MTERRGHYDLLGIGLGPFNLGLAALLDDCETNAVFLDEQSSFSWHGGMQIEGTSLEVPFLADMVSLADPTSEYSYLNYLRETGRIYEFYFYETFQIPRREYEAYMQWVAERLDTTRFSRRVKMIDHRDGTFVVTAADPETGGEYVYTADDIALGVGSRPFVPDEFRDLRGPSFFHTAGYRDRRADVLDADSITVVGSGQSGAEVVLDLLDRQPDHGYRVDWLTRSDGFFPMEYSKLGLQHFTPEYAQYFYDLPDERKDEIRTDQDLLYKGIDVDTSAAIYDRLYERSIGDRVPEFGMLAMTAVTDVTPTDDGYRLACRQHQQDERFVHDTDVVVLATGYHRPTPRSSTRFGRQSTSTTRAGIASPRIIASKPVSTDGSSSRTRTSTPTASARPTSASAVIETPSSSSSSPARRSIRSTATPSSSSSTWRASVRTPPPDGDGRPRRPRTEPSDTAAHHGSPV